MGFAAPCHGKRVLDSSSTQGPNSAYDDAEIFRNSIDKPPNGDVPCNERYFPHSGSGYKIASSRISVARGCYDLGSLDGNPLLDRNDLRCRCADSLSKPASRAPFAKIGRILVGRLLRCNGKLPGRNRRDEKSVSLLTFADCNQRFLGQVVSSADEPMESVRVEQNARQRRSAFCRLAFPSRL
jgi:hypothetical protein